MSEPSGQADERVNGSLAPARGPGGEFVTRGEKRKPATVERRRQLKERDYLRSVTAKVGREDIDAVAAAIVADAKGGESVDPKTCNAAREWLGKYLLGNARVALDDCDDMPAIVRRR